MIRFEGDPLAKGRDTLVYGINPTANLRQFQKDIVDRLNPLRTNDQEQWVLSQSDQYTSKQLDSIRKYGYPYGPEDWKFHASVASAKSGILNGATKQYDKPYSWKADVVSIYTLKNHERGFEHFADIPLGKKELV